MELHFQRDEQGLGHAARTAAAELLVEDAFVHGMLVEDEQGIILLGKDEVGARNLPEPAEIVQRRDPWMAEPEKNRLYPCRS